MLEEIIDKDEKVSISVTPLGQIMCEILKVRYLITFFGIINIILIISCLLIMLIK